MAKPRIRNVEVPGIVMLDRGTEPVPPRPKTDTVRSGGAPQTAARVKAKPPPSEEIIAPATDSPWQRYYDLGLLGRGGMGEVRRVRDRVLDRVLAMKILLVDEAASETARVRFLAEARLAAGLQHPGIVPVYDCGEMPDGRLWFTMKEVRGESLRATIAAAYAAERSGLSPATLRRLVDIYARACEAVAYAHRHGVIHRDLKPENVLLAELGEVHVVDWGLARPTEHAESATNEDGDRLTLTDQVMGTPAYMPPEQARGERDSIGPRSDVYALGAVLYEILCGKPPYEGSADEVLGRVQNEPPEPLSARAQTPPPDDLLSLCERAMARSPMHRFPHAGALAAEVRSWLEGVRRRDRSVAVLAEAEELAPKMEELRQKARELRSEAAAILGGLQTWDPAEEKARGWALEDAARAHEVAAAVQRVAWETKIHAALTESPELRRAHDALAARYAAELLASEKARDIEGAARAEALLRLHDHGRFGALLEGRGAVSLAIDPEGAEVELFRYVEKARRLVAEPVGPIGKAPLRSVSLPHGSYVLCVRAPRYRELRYPVRIGRGEHWDGVPPGASRQLVIPLLPNVESDPDDIYVPAGWFAAGGDPSAGDSLPAQRIWVDGFVIRKHPVTVEEYLAFLNDLVARGREEEAEAACPRVAKSLAGDHGTPLLDRDAGGRFVPGASSDASLRCPIASITWYAAAAYAAWRADADGLPWRLPSELEWEKAARGVDGRFFPWGDQQEPTWACMVGSRAAGTVLATVDDYPMDESPYGVRGLAGNVRDWCIDAWAGGGPTVDGGRLRIEPAPDPSAPRSIRGGCWTAAPPFCRAASRFIGDVDARGAGLGLRLARSVGSRRRTMPTRRSVAGL
jgi:serine/threonine-protein kinase